MSPQNLVLALALLVAAGCAGLDAFPEPDAEEPWRTEALGEWTPPPAEPAPSASTHVFGRDPGRTVTSSRGDGSAALFERVGGASDAPPAEPDRATWGQQSRSRADELEEMTQQLLLVTQEAIREVEAETAARVAGLGRPATLATNEVGLEDWGRTERQDYQARVEAIHAEALEQIQAIESLALDTAEQRATAIAQARSPLDQGPTGDPALDATLTTFAEILHGTIGKEEMSVRREQDRSHALELVQVFSSARDEGAVHLGERRILLFGGGDQSRGDLNALLAFRGDGTELSDWRVEQVVRHRIMRGDALVADMGWRPAPAPGEPGVMPAVVDGDFLVAPHIEPRLDTSAAAFQELRDMRIVSDVQTAVRGASGGILGGVDWRIEFLVSVRGALTWRLDGSPRYDPWCTEVKLLMGE